jgi:hypothetical protein
MIKRDGKQLQELSNEKMMSKNFEMMKRDGKQTQGQISEKLTIKEF